MTDDECLTSFPFFFLLSIHVYLEGERQRDASILPLSCYILNMSLRLRCQFVKAASVRTHLPCSHPLLTSINLSVPNVIRTLEAVLLFLGGFGCIVCDMLPTIGSLGASKRLGFIAKCEKLSSI